MDKGFNDLDSIPPPFHAKWDPESLYGLTLNQSSRTANIVEEGSVENFEYLIDTTHYDNKDGLLYVCLLLIDLLIWGSELTS